MLGAGFRRGRSVEIHIIWPTSRWLLAPHESLFDCLIWPSFLGDWSNLVNLDGFDAKKGLEKSYDESKFTECGMSHVQAGPTKS